MVPLAMLGIHVLLNTTRVVLFYGSQAELIDDGDKEKVFFINNNTSTGKFMSHSFSGPQLIALAGWAD